MVSVSAIMICFIKVIYIITNATICFKVKILRIIEHGRAQLSIQILFQRASSFLYFLIAEVLPKKLTAVCTFCNMQSKIC